MMLLQPLQTEEGALEAKLFIPDADWTHTHLFGGKGAYPFWRSNLPVAPNVPQVIYVNGTRTRIAKPVMINIKSYPGNLMIQFEGKWYSIEVPY